MDRREFRNPAFDVNAGGIVAGGLGPRVLDPEIRRGVRAGAGGPLPAAVVRGDLAIDEVLHEVGFAEFPVDVQILGEKHRGDHPDAVVHETGGQQLAHAGIDDGKSGAAVFPCLEERAGFVPRQAAPVGVEFLVEHVREMVEDGEIEFPPGEFLDEDVDSGAAGGIGRGAGFHRLRINRADRDQAETQVLGNPRSAVVGREIPFGGVGLDFSGDGAFQSFAGGPFAGFEDLVLREPASPQVATVGRGREVRSRGSVERRGFAEGRGFWQGQPIAAVGRVNPVGLAALGEHLVRAVQGGIGMASGIPRRARRTFPGPAFHLFPEGIGVRVEMERHGTALADQLPQSLDRIAAADDQTAAEGFQIAGQ